MAMCIIALAPTWKLCAKGKRLRAVAGFILSDVSILHLLRVVSIELVVRGGTYAPRHAGSLIVCHDRPGCTIRFQNELCGEEEGRIDE